MDAALAGINIGGSVDGSRNDEAVTDRKEASSKKTKQKSKKATAEKSPKRKSETPEVDNNEESTIQIRGIESSQKRTKLSHIANGVSETNGISHAEDVSEKRKKRRSEGDTACDEGKAKKKKKKTSE